ncbi:quercetin 2,3-dioxygenase [Kribbella sp. NBC_01245]|uniref:quercetin 2,3-dioxygenase n=1 Tax=Kribbella sp. NBC_01245 TaxID=2903578 RepID=UPI002E2AE938|nr:quercetin 2,3-dioxygenase [Kribbella sp. NBC_01245]
MKTLAVTVRASGEGERAWFCGGGLFTWKVTAEESGGMFLVLEDEMEFGKVTPMHLHPETDETFYLLDGEVLLDVDGDQRTLGTGSIAAIPRGIPHAFMVTSPTARMLAFQTPGNNEAFYRMASEPFVAGGPPAPVDFDRIRAAAIETGAIEILGPPPFPQHQ